MEQQAEQPKVVFDHLISASVVMKGVFEPMSSANPFKQSNAQGELKHIDSLEDITNTALTSGVKLVKAFTQV